MQDKDAEPIQKIGFELGSFSLANDRTLFHSDGPRHHHSNVDNDAGGITTYSLAGAQTASDSSGPHSHYDLPDRRTGDVRPHGGRHGEGLSDLSGKSSAPNYVLSDDRDVSDQLGNVISEFAVLRQDEVLESINSLRSLERLSGLVMVVKGTYRLVEKVFWWPVSLHLLHHHRDHRKTKLGGGRPAVPSSHVSLQPAEMTMVIGLVGTTIAPWMQFYLQASIVEKGIKLEEYKFARFDVIMGSVVVHIVAFFIILVCAETLFKTGEDRNGQRCRPVPRSFGRKYCTYLFAFGLVNPPFLPLPSFLIDDLSSSARAWLGGRDR